MSKIDHLIVLILDLNTMLPFIILTLVATKITLFMMYKTRRWKTYHLIYFNSRHLLLSDNQRSYKLKKQQNLLTIIIAILVLWYQVILLLSKLIHINF